MVESAAFGAPSIANGGGKVGAAVMLGEERGCLTIDLERIIGSNDENDDISDETKYARCEFSERLSTLLMSIDSCHEEEEAEDDDDMERWTPLSKIANEARSRALGWDEMACSRGLVNILNGLHPSKQMDRCISKKSNMVPLAGMIASNFIR